MSFQTTCANCSNHINIKDEWVGRWLKCPRCGLRFQAERPTSAPSRSVPYAANTPPVEREPAPSRFNLPFTLGPDDRYPRVLYWALLVYLLCDSIYAIPILLPILREDPNTHYHGERLVGWAAAIVVPPGIGAAVVCAIPVAALIYSVYKIALLGVILSSAMGTAIAGAPVEQSSVGLQAAWHVLGIVLGGWYYLMRWE